MKICLVTTFPPSTGGLSEYGFHIAQELQRNPFLSLTVLADELPRNHAEPEGFDVLRCWSFDDPGTAFRLLSTIRRLKPDVVWFNLLFSTFGRNPFVAFSGLMTPLLARLSGRYSHVTLHHLIDTVELKDVGVRHENIFRIAGAVATRMLLLSNSVSVLMPGYRKILNDKYGRDNVHLRAHGLLARRPEFPDFSRRGAPVHRILAFGKWGTYKRLELMIEAFNHLTAELPQARLVIAGGNHPQAGGYVESVKKRNADNPCIEFRGYVPEDELADLFQSSSVAVMPYSSSTGCSGVAHLACAFGVPIVSADLVDFRQMAQSEELSIEFYPAGDARGLADCLRELLTNTDKQHSMAVANFTAALRMTMPNVVQKYLRHFELQQRVQTLRHVARVRRLPRWIPSKSLLLRLLTRNQLSWARRSAVLRTSWTDLPAAQLLHSDGNGRGHLHGTGLPIHGDDIVVPSGAGTTVWVDAIPAAGHSAGNHNGNGANGHNGNHPLTLNTDGRHDSEQPQAPQPIGEEDFPPVAAIRGNSGTGSDSEYGLGTASAGRDGLGRE